MHKLIIFGGTTEGRKLCEICAMRGIPALYAVATPDGAQAVAHLQHITVHVGRLSLQGMADLLAATAPELVLDATHPYAQEAGQNIAAACQSANIPLLRVTRETGTAAQPQADLSFRYAEDLLSWLAHEPGNVFSAMGASFAGVLAKLPDFQSRVWLRVLPSLDSLRICLELGYPAQHIICMQGPFSEELNAAMFKAADARILVTKNSGAVGGFAEKVRAAKSLGMKIAICEKLEDWKKPEAAKGCSLEEACKRIWEWKP